MIKLIIFVSLLWSCTFSLVAQEICNNGIDDDGDGLIDCYDTDCCIDSACAGFYYLPCVDTNTSSCAIDSLVGGFSMREVWRGTATVSNYNIPVVGDLDGDGIPEIVAARGSTIDALKIFDSRTGVVKRTIPVSRGGSDGSGLVLADMDLDGQPEIVVPRSGDVFCYNPDGTLLWQSANGITGSRSAIATVADINQDGVPEVLVRNTILNGQTGVTLGSFSGSYGNTAGSPNIIDAGVSILADVLPDAFCADCAGLEIIAGNAVYSVNINTVANTATIVRQVQLNTQPDGLTAVADWDGDGDLDGIITHTVGNQARLYVWDLQTPTLMMTTGNIARGGTRCMVGVGVSTVADLDNDNQLEAVFVLNQRLVVIENDGTIKWSITNGDCSGITGVTVYDFDGNGQYELVYRDEFRLQVFDANTGVLLQALSCQSLTQHEYPIIADIDGDGETEILCTCGTRSGSGFVTAFESAGTPWVPSRPLWNQYQYFSTNINDDLTVPRIQQSHHIVGDSIELNAIRKQYQATGQTPLPDAAIQILSSNSVLPDSVDLNIQICNLGDAVLSANTPITFYNADPTTNNLAIPVGSISPIGQKVEAGNCITQTYRVLGTSSDIYAVVNCDNSILPIFNLSTDLPMTTIAECDYINNMANRTILLNSDLLDFDVERHEQNQVKLEWNWSTRTQGVVTVERSGTGIDFESLGIATNQHLFIDIDPLIGTNYYRLKKMTADRKIQYSPIRALQITDRYAMYPVMLSPNPFRDYIDIKTNATVKSIVIVNTLGQVVYAQSFEEGITTSKRVILAGLESGIYWVRINTKETTLQYTIIRA